MTSETQPVDVHPDVLHRALIIDGEPFETQHIAGILRKNGLGVEIAPSGRIGFERVLARHVDVIVLDIDLPDSNGLVLIRKFRGASIATPIIVRSTHDFLSTKLRALDFGADDYVTKSVDHRELMARIANVIRRAPIPPTEVVRFADLVMDERSHRVYRAGASLDLSLTLFRLLRHFMLNPGQILSKESLFLAAWGEDDPCGATPTDSSFLHDNSVQISVSRLRKLLGRHGPPLIHTLRHRGYILRGPTT